MQNNKESMDYLKKLVKERLAAMPPDVSFSVGGFGEFSSHELIKEVENGTDVGKAIVDMEIQFIKEMPKLLSRAKM